MEGRWQEGMGHACSQAMLYTCMEISKSKKYKSKIVAFLLAI